jgi:hypothetical protein
MARGSTKVYKEGRIVMLVLEGQHEWFAVRKDRGCEIAHRQYPDGRGRP